jgi:hypothetical protein
VGEENMIIIEKDKGKREQARYELTQCANPVVGICEEIRLIYDTVYELPKSKIKDAIVEQLIDVLIMAKDMGKRLSYYYETYKDMTGHEGENLIQLPHTRERWKMRRKRI